MAFFFSLPLVKANSINRIDMDIYIDSDGNASVTEVWDAYLNQGTEGYRPYTKLNGASITNFRVSDDSGRVYDALASWNTGANFDYKAYKSGLHYISQGVELCFGISKYGKRTYTLNYDINNFVVQYTDTQGIYFDFLNLDQEVGAASITIHSDIPFSLDNTRIWAFGYQGSDTFSDGSIILDSNGSLAVSQYMVGLIRFEDNLFKTANKSNESFQDVYDSAFSDVPDGDYNNTNNKKIEFKDIIFGLAIVILYAAVNPISWIICIVVLITLTVPTKPSSTLNFGAQGRKLPADSEINYWRDIPCNKDLERAYWVCLQYRVVPEKTLNQGIIGAILLKGIKNGYITVTETKKGLFSLKDNNYAIHFNDINIDLNDTERDLFNMLKDAAGYNKILEAQEFAKWSRKNYIKIKDWFATLSSREENMLEQEGLITRRVEETKGAFGIKRKNTIKDVNPNLKEEAIQMMGLKKFLLDFSIMPEREYFEVHIWEEYLIFAMILGIADKVEEQFSKLYPNFNHETLLNTEMTTVAVRSMAILCYEGMQEGVARAAARSSSSYSGSSRDTGGGGSSYSGGGSSSGGSSGGGFR